MVMGRQLDNILRQMSDTTKLTYEIEALKKELATSNNEKKETLNNISNVKREKAKLLSEWNTWKSQHNEA